jgi:hypothetical protein
MHWLLLRLGDRSIFESGKNSTEGDLRTVAECYILLSGIQGWGCGYDQIWNLNAPQAVQKGRPARPQRAKGRGGTYQASLEPLASITCERIGTLPPPWYVEALSDARTMLADFINSLLTDTRELLTRQQIEDSMCANNRLQNNHRRITVHHHSNQGCLLRCFVSPHDSERSLGL